jgi:hypothetical protein
MTQHALYRFRDIDGEPYLPADLTNQTAARLETDQPDQETADA